LTFIWLFLAINKFYIFIVWEFLDKNWLSAKNFFDPFLLSSKKFGWPPLTVSSRNSFGPLLHFFHKIPQKQQFFKTRNFLLGQQIKQKYFSPQFPTLFFAKQANINFKN
jgi:hypothetical protein